MFGMCDNRQGRQLQLTAALQNKASNANVRANGPPIAVPELDEETLVTSYCCERWACPMVV
eukprot:1231458-Amphidinium_carterae.1